MEELIIASESSEKVDQPMHDKVIFGAPAGTSADRSIASEVNDSTR